MVVLIRQFNTKLATVPGQSFLPQLLKTLLVKPISNSHCQYGAYLSLEVYQSCEAKSEHHLRNHQIFIFGVVVIPILFLEVTDVEVDEDVQHLSSQYYQHFIRLKIHRYTVSLKDTAPRKRITIL